MKTKKLLSILLSIILIISICPFGIFELTASATATSGTCGDSVYWSYNTSSNTLTIFGQGAISNYFSTKYSLNYGYHLVTTAPWREYYTEIKTLVIENGVTSIGNNAFYHCSELISVTIPDSVTMIGESAFSDCYNLTSVTIPNSVTTLNERAFHYCRGLMSIVIPGSIKTISQYAFRGCTGLASVTIGNGVTEIVGSAFEDCTGLTNITMSNSVTSIGVVAFRGCTKLTNITIPDGVTTIGMSAFYGCTDLTDITVSDSVTSIGNDAFYNTAWYNNQPDGLVYAGKIAYKYKGTCPEIVAIKDGTIGIADSAFSACNGLKSITIPNSITSIGSWAFSNCTNLTSIALPNSVTKINWGAFNNCIGLTSIIIPDTLTVLGGRAFYGCTGLTRITIPDSVTEIDWGVFYGCTGLVIITIPNSVTSIGDSAFENCTGLISVHYQGTEYEWNNILINSNNSHLTNATRTYCTRNVWFERIAPTCIKAGVEYGTCTICGKEATRTINALGHSFTNYISNNDATCTQDGTKTAKCERCDATDTIIDIDSKFNHNYIAVVIPPACTAQGYTTYTCTHCGNSYVDDYINPIGHIWGEWTVTTPATCTEAGVETRVCANDSNHVETRKIAALGHDFIHHNDKTPTCTEIGWEAYDTCSRCNYTTYSEIAALNHSWGVWVTLAPATCTTKGIEMRICSNDPSHIENRYVDELGHNYIAVITAPTHTKMGYTTYTCTHCGNSYVDDYTDIIPNNHTPGDINGDDAVNNKDLTRLFQYLSDWDVEVTEAALDINGDGSVNNKDLTRLFQYLSDWDVEIY